jgi:AcrR family transcriptional regulator
METGRKRLSVERRTRIVDAARHLILKNGFKGMTMEAIAREARIAKPTLYAYFPDKESVYGAILETLTAELRSAFHAAISAPGDAATRIGNALATKYQLIADLLAGSPHAEELYSDEDRHVKAQLQALESEMAEAVVACLAEAGVSNPQDLASLILAGTFGIGRKYPLPEIGPAVRQLVERLVAPELAQSPRGRK